MGESAVLVHSYSFAAPITRNDSHEDKTIHALSQSISFGKFMTENLEWGKWSSFSHKKYVEEAEKYSRPGSVAQKKAFFEAHYKRIAEAKKAATQEQPTVTPAEVLLHALETQPPLNIIQDEDTARKSIRIDHVVVDSDNKPVLVDDSLEVKEDLHKEDGLIGDDDDDDDDDDKEEELVKLKEELPVGEKEEKKRRSITKNKPVFRLSLEKTIPPKPVEEIALPDKTSERPIIHNSEKPVRGQRFSFLSCFRGNSKTQDQNQLRKKRKTLKKKQSMCFCLKPKTVRES
uniref:Protein WVD2-like 7 n=1 Tax=Noccaea caerulescens TaxID=107243 RepID=A0A1J3FAZ9_NOCCA